MDTRARSTFLRLIDLLDRSFDVLVKHLPGQHSQSTHGRGPRAPADIKQEGVDKIQGLRDQVEDLAASDFDNRIQFADEVIGQTAEAEQAVRNGAFDVAGETLVSASETLRSNGETGLGRKFDRTATEMFDLGEEFEAATARQAA